MGIQLQNVSLQLLRATKNGYLTKDLLQLATRELRLRVKNLAKNDRYLKFLTTNIFYKTSTHT